MSQSDPNLPPQKRIRWGLLVFLALVGILILGGVLVLAGLGALMKGKTVSVKADSTLVLVLDRPLQEPQPDPFMTEFFHAKLYCVYDVVSALDRAAKDDRIKSVLLDVSAFPSGLGKIQEIREAVERFRASKKPVWAYFESAHTGGYYLATEADKIYAPPSADLLLAGPVAEMPFLRGVLDKVHIQPQLYHIGDYKSYSDTFMRKEMSDAQREATDAILDSFYRQIVEGISKSRRLSPDQVRSAIDQAFYWGKQLKDLGLVDDLLYRDQVEDGLKKINGTPDKWRRVYLEDYIRDQRSDTAAGARKSIALVLASGGIVSGEGSSQGGMGSEENIGSDTMVRMLRKVGEDKDVAAVVLRVDSPGGSGLASDVIWRQIEILRKTKPVVVSMSDVAGSGGYYIAMGADAIVAQPSTITGSIGVVSGKFVIKGLLDFIDYRQETMMRGTNSDIFSGYTPFTPQQETLIQDQMAGFYKVFVSKAADGRKKSYEDIDKVGQGRIWSGEDALKIGLVDRLGGIDTAIALAKEKAKLAKDEPVRIKLYPRPKSLFESFLQASPDELSAARTIAVLPPELLQAYRDYEAMRPLAAEPFALYATMRIRM